MSNNLLKIGIEPEVLKDLHSMALDDKADNVLKDKNDLETKPAFDKQK